jgi:hypothetical protein
VKPESSAPPTLPADVDAKSSAGAPPRSLTHPRPTTARSRSEGSGTADRPGRSRRLSHAAASAPKQSYRGRPSALSLWTTGTRLAVTPPGCRFARLKQAWSRRWARCSGLVLGSSQIRWAAGYRSRRGSGCHVPAFRGKGAFGMACRRVTAAGVKRVSPTSVAGAVLLPRKGMVKAAAPDSGRAALRHPCAGVVETRRACGQPGLTVQLEAGS